MAKLKTNSSDNKTSCDAPDEVNLADDIIQCDTTDMTDMQCDTTDDALLNDIQHVTNDMQDASLQRKHKRKQSEPRRISHTMDIQAVKSEVMDTCSDNYAQSDEEEEEEEEENNLGSYPSKFLSITSPDDGQIDPFQFPAHDDDEDIISMSGGLSLHDHGSPTSDDGDSNLSRSSKRNQRSYKNLSKSRRIVANARERNRVHTISAAFEGLRRAVPSYSHNQKLSKLAILRIACSYILALAKLADKDYTPDEESQLSFSECVDMCTKTLQSEGRSKRRKVPID